jgi:hypothetical protein
VALLDLVRRGLDKVVMVGRVDLGKRGSVCHGGMMLCSCGRFEMMIELREAEGCVAVADSEVWETIRHS